MPKLTSQRKTKTIELKSYEGAQVEVYETLTVGDLEHFDENSSAMQQALYLLPRLIKSWNFTDENEQPLAINKESIKMLSADAIMELTKDFEQNKFEAKKD